MQPNEWRRGSDDFGILHPSLPMLSNIVWIDHLDIFLVCWCPISIRHIRIPTSEVLSLVRYIQNHLWSISSVCFEKTAVALSRKIWENSDVSRVIWYIYHDYCIRRTPVATNKTSNTKKKARNSKKPQVVAEQTTRKKRKSTSRTRKERETQEVMVEEITEQISLLEVVSDSAIAAKPFLLVFSSLFCVYLALALFSFAPNDI